MHSRAIMVGGSVLVAMLAAFALRSSAAEIDPAAKVGEPAFNEKRGVWQYQVESPFTKGKNVVEVLLPDQFDKAKQYRVLYVLPVEMGENHNFGDGLQEVRKLGVHNRHDVICVGPTFDGAMPWYGAHATDTRIRHEDYLVKVVVPLIESRYPTLGAAEGRLLLGFSKSGWGAFSLLLRNSGFFGYAASWDAPLMMTERQFGAFETRDHFGTPENFASYMIVNLLREHAKEFQDKPRLVLAGSSLFGPQPGKAFADSPHTLAAHALMQELGIKHLYNNDLPKGHHWGTGWVGPVVDMLMSLAKQ